MNWVDAGVQSQRGSEGEQRGLFRSGSRGKALPPGAPGPLCRAGGPWSGCLVSPPSPSFRIWPLATSVRSE